MLHEEKGTCNTAVRTARKEGHICTTHVDKEVGLQGCIQIKEFRIDEQSDNDINSVKSKVFWIFPLSVYTGDGATHKP